MFGNEQDYDAFNVIKRLHSNIILKVQNQRLQKKCIESKPRKSWSVLGKMKELLWLTSLSCFQMQTECMYLGQIPLV